MRFSLITLLLWGTLCHADDAALSFTPSHVSLVPQAPQWAPAVTDKEQFGYAEPLPPFHVELQSTPIAHTTLDSTEYPPSADAILCNISFKGTLSDGKGFSATTAKIQNNSDSIGLKFNANTIPSTTQLQLKGTLRYDIRSGTGTETLPAVAIKGRGEYKTAGYIIHYLPDAGEGTKEHVFMVMPPDRTKRSAAAIEDIVFTDKNGKKWSHGNGTLCREEVWYTEDTICFASEEKIETDHGSLQIILKGKAKTHSESINQSISLTPAKTSRTHTAPPKEVQLRHVKTEFAPQASEADDNKFVMTWQQCYSERHQHIRDAFEEERNFSVLDAEFIGTVTDETGYSIPLTAHHAEYSSDGFLVELANKQLMPKGFKLHVKGTLGFTVYSPTHSTLSGPVAVQKNGSAQCGVYTIEYITVPKKIMAKELQHFIRVKTDEQNKKELKRIAKITVNGVDIAYWDKQDNTCVIEIPDEEAQPMPDTAEVTLHLMQNGQHYTTSIDRIIDLSSNN